MRKHFAIILVTAAIIMAACAKKEENKMNGVDYTKGTFGYDVNFLSKKYDVIVLEDGDAKILLSAKLQSRVMTATSGGMNGKSFGWINYDLINEGVLKEHINPFGGEERFWIGPEGGQFSVFFKQGVEFDFEHWFTPKEIDTDEYTAVSKDERKAVFQKEMHFVNYSGNPVDLRMDRTVKILSKGEIRNNIGEEIPTTVRTVAFKSENEVTNIGKSAWTKETGAPSIWMLGMFNCSPNVTVAVPFKKGNEEELGKIVTDDYFGKVPEERLKVEEGIMFFKGDGDYRSKIGISPKRATKFCGSYDKDNNTLTIMQFSLNESTTDYVNSLWKHQDNPFSGDAINSYNDGPNETGGRLGKFYELENSSPALFLKPGESYSHNSMTYHFTGSEEDLNKIAQKIFGVSLEKIKTAFK